MKYKKVYTVIPECSIGNTKYCTQDCSVCQLAKKTKVIPVSVPDSQAVPIAYSIDKETMSLNDIVTVVMEYSGVININELDVKVSEGLEVVSTTLDDTHTIVTIKIKKVTPETGIGHILVTYKGITRSFIVQFTELDLFIMDFKSSDTSIELGSTIRLDVTLSRALKPNESFPVIKYDSSIFELIQPIKQSITIPTNFYMLLQAKVDNGNTVVIASLPNSISDDKTIDISIVKEEIVYATEEDIDFLFPELHS